MFSLFLDKRSKRGLLDHLGLLGWWDAELTDAERQRILAHYKPMGSDSASLIEGEQLSTSQSPLSLLWGLATWFKAPEDYPLALKIIRKGEELAPIADLIDVHFLFHSKIEIAYRNRNHVSDALEVAVQACEQQIAISRKVADRFREEQRPDLPGHKGYQQLAIIKEKLDRYEDAVRICGQAQREGWLGDWTSRIERLTKKSVNKPCSV